MDIADNLLGPIVLVTGLGCGLMAGLFFAFSVAVMRGLSRLEPAAGMAAMQAINVAIVNPLFLAVFFGTAAGSVLVIVLAVMRSGSAYLIVGGALYLLGGILVTMVFNVPRNNALATARATEDGVETWSTYLREWTAWNHVRTVACLGAAALLTAGMCI